jgi:hypothetical protein
MPQQQMQELKVLATSFTTCSMTGELFTLLLQHTVLD